MCICGIEIGISNAPRILLHYWIVCVLAMHVFNVGGLCLNNEGLYLKYITLFVPILDSSCHTTHLHLGVTMYIIIVVTLRGRPLTPSSIIAYIMDDP